MDALKLDALTAAEFSSRLHQRFLVADAEVVQLELVEVTSAPSPQPGAREPFSLVFLGPPSPILGQGIRALQNDSIGRIEIFLVPIGRAPEGIQYQAVFG